MLCVCVCVCVCACVCVCVCVYNYIIFTLCSCFPLDEQHICYPHSSFKYTSDQNLTHVKQLIIQYNHILNHPDDWCESAAIQFICYAFLPPCNLTTGTPRPLCSNACFYFTNICKKDYNTILGGLAIEGYPDIDNCENTFNHLNEFGFSNSSQDFADDCIDITGEIFHDCNCIMCVTGCM